MDDPGGQEHTMRTGKRNGCVNLRLYVANQNPRCLAAYENLVRICEAYAAGSYRITVIDLAKNPGIARADQITAIPTLIRLPRDERMRKIIGTLSDERRVARELGLTAEAGHHPAPAALPDTRK